MKKIKNEEKLAKNDITKILRAYNKSFLELTFRIESTHWLTYYLLKQLFKKDILTNEDILEIIKKAEKSHMENLKIIRQSRQENISGS